MKPKLLVLELWGLGDQGFATPFLRAASECFRVTLLAKPTATDLQPHFWPRIEVAPFTFPWTALHGKYRLYRWPWRELMRLTRKLRAERFEIGLSARWDPRDHFLLALFGVRRRYGFPRVGSRIFLNHPLTRPEVEPHRYEYWRLAGQALGMDLPPLNQLPRPPKRTQRTILLHSGASTPLRVWPLDRYLNLVRRLRHLNHPVQVVCDPNQRDWWRSQGEDQVAVPQSVAELVRLLEQSGLFIGNDSGPGHVAAIQGVPTFTLFGPQIPERFVPVHPAAEWMEGKPCPYKPCFDYCRFPSPHCLFDVTEGEVWEKVEAFVHRNLELP